MRLVRRAIVRVIRRCCPNGISWMRRDSTALRSLATRALITPIALRARSRSSSHTDLRGMRVRSRGLTASDLADSVGFTGGLGIGGGSSKAGGANASPGGNGVRKVGVEIDRSGVRDSSSRQRMIGDFGDDSSSRQRVIADFCDGGGVLE